MKEKYSLCASGSTPTKTLRIPARLSTSARSAFLLSRSRTIAMLQDVDSLHRIQDMKCCVECGLENTDAATQCSHCGSREFSPAAPLKVTSPKELKAKRLLVRLAVAVIVGLAVAGLSLRVAWGNACNAISARLEQYFTQHDLRLIAKDIEVFHQKFGKYPSSLDDVRSMVDTSVNGGDWYGHGRPRDLVDGWGRPFVISFDGNSCIVTSYGRDGLPGGNGLDCDLTSRDCDPKNARPTFYQFLYDMPVHGMITSCLVCGGLACLLALLTIKVPNLEARGLLSIAFRFGATIIGATWVAIIISGLHVPSGH